MYEFVGMIRKAIMIEADEERCLGNSSTFFLYFFPRHRELCLLIVRICTNLSSSLHIPSPKYEYSVCAILSSHRFRIDINHAPKIVTLFMAGRGYAI